MCHKSEAVGFMSLAPSRIDNAVIVKSEYIVSTNILSVLSDEASQPMHVMHSILYR